MELLIDLDGQQRLTAYFASIGAALGSPARQASFATYAWGLLGDGERKSMEPIAARACGDPAEVDAAHHRLQHFITDSGWSDLDIRRAAARASSASLRMAPSRPGAGAAALEPAARGMGLALL